jgi:hypothetical protein
MAKITAAGTMTDPSADRIPSGEWRSRGALGAIWVAAAIFLALLALLATRVATGQDPALRAHAAAAPAPVRRVLIRRVYERRVIVHVPPSAPTQPTRASQQVSSAGGSAPSPPLTRTS